MGVTGLWPILAPSARPTPLPTLNRKRLAVDASIWIYQFLKAVRDKDGNALHNSHVVGFFRRICKLLYFGIKPVFVFDGGAPILKRQTILMRKKRREGRREDAIRTAGKLLAVQMKRKGEEEEVKRKRERERSDKGLPLQLDEEEELPIDKELVYVGEMGMSSQERNHNRTFRKTDAYHLPELTNGIEGMGRPNDPRIMSAEELEAYARQFSKGEDVNLYDFSKIDFNGEFFMSLPAGDRYNILNAARLRSRLRMGLSKEQLKEMFPDRMAFSRFQIDRVRERNELTQRLMNLNGMNNDLVGVGGGRIASERGREYVLVKNDGVEGGWALGVVSTDNGEGLRNKPIDVEALGRKTETFIESEEEEAFEDVPVEGLNRLPKVKETQNMTHEDYRACETPEQRKWALDSKHGRILITRNHSENPDSLFVSDNFEGFSENRHQVDSEGEDINRTIAKSLQIDVDDPLTGLEDGHVREAIALSLRKNHKQESGGQEDAFEDALMPHFEQRAVQLPKPLNKASGGVIAHIVNNRANAAVPKRKAVDISSDSDDDMNLQATLAKARKNRAFKKHQLAPVASNEKNPFDGPLPFESLGSIFGKTNEKISIPDAVDEDDIAGGFDNDLQADSIPKPIPPWLVGGGDIRSDVEVQRKRDQELNAEDRERALEEEREFMKKHGMIIIESSDEEDGVLEVLEAPPTNCHHRKSEEPGPLVSIISQDRLTTSEAHAEQLSSVELQEDEEVVWSDSDYGDKDSKEANNGVKAGATAITDKTSEIPEFEDIEMPQSNTAIVDGLSATSRSMSLSPLFEDVEISHSAATFSSGYPSISKTSQIPDDFNPDKAPVTADFHDFSDPEDEELLTQMEIEAEEHARFASTLNNKSELENQQEYEKELKTLRSQQKKDRRDADEVSQTMITECQALLRLFGLPYITAPMEAEAQCAELVRLGLVDGVVTDDCDIFLFGGTRVYKNMFSSNKFVECYLAADIEKELSLSRDQLISIAHLLGSDYTEGLHGIGPVIALEIISEFDSISAFASWWNSAQYLTTPETSTFRKKFRRTQAAKLFLPSGFPSPAVTEAYWRPEVDSDTEPFKWGVPDLERLRDFLMVTIGWSRERTDEVLVPVIRDLNRRELEGTQSNVTRFFDGGLGTGIRGQVGAGINSGKGGSKRMRDAVGKLQAKKAKPGKLDKTFADEAREWVEREKSGKNQGSAGQMAMQAGRKGKGGKGQKGKKGKSVTPVTDDDGGRGCR